MLQIDNTIISLDILEKKFVCDIEQCKGECCVQGDSGAPLTDDEIDILESEFNKIKPFMTQIGVDAIEDMGLYWIDSEGEKVTTLINKKECAFVVNVNGISKCSIEIAFNNKKTKFLKPISCHLYPIRVKNYEDFSAVNYNTWNICKPAVRLGNHIDKPLYQFLEEPLKRKFGKEWYKQLVYAANNLEIK